MITIQTTLKTLRPPVAFQNKRFCGMTSDLFEESTRLTEDGRLTIPLQHLVMEYAKNLRDNPEKKLSRSTVNGRISAVLTSLITTISNLTDV
jgi:hypothetical protein